MNRKHLLRLSNYEEFLAYYTYTGPDYILPHDILLQLEKMVVDKEYEVDNVQIQCSDYSYCIFTFDRFFRDGNNSYVVYDFNFVER